MLEAQVKVVHVLGAHQLCQGQIAPLSIQAALGEKELQGTKGFPWLTLMCAHGLHYTTLTHLDPLFGLFLRNALIPDAPGGPKKIVTRPRNPWLWAPTTRAGIAPQGDGTP